MTNLIMIDCHDLGQHLGSYGCITVPSPNLDTLAADGILFKNSFCTAPQCSPSRAALYTGRYPHANGMFGLAHKPFNWRMHRDEIHLAGYLQLAGYHTTLVGVQHVTGHETSEIKKLGYQQIWLEDRSDKVGEIVENYLKNAPSQPFFLNVGFFSPHRDSHGRFTQAPPDRSLGVEVPPYLPQTSQARDEFAEIQGVIRQVDNAIGVIWKALCNHNLLDNTWVIFTTDHGIAMPRAKCTLFDPGIKTALIMFAEPFGLVGGQVYHDLISNVDVVPTILEMLDLDIPDRIQGQSFANLLRREPYLARQAIFAEKTFHTAYEPQRVIRTNRYKLIWNAEAGIINVPADIMHSPIYPQMIEQIASARTPFELYDLHQDILEYENLILNPRFEDLFQDMRNQLLRWMQQTNDPILQAPIASPFYYHALGLLTEGAA